MNATKAEGKRKKRERTKTVKKLVDDFKIENKRQTLKAQAEFTKYKKYTREEVDQLQEVIERYEKHEN